MIASGILHSNEKGLANGKLNHIKEEILDKRADLMLLHAKRFQLTRLYDQIYSVYGDTQSLDIDEENSSGNTEFDGMDPEELEELQQGPPLRCKSSCDRYPRPNQTKPN